MLWVVPLPSLGDGWCSESMVGVDRKLWYWQLGWKEWYLFRIQWTNNDHETERRESQNNNNKGEKEGLYDEQEQILNYSKQQIPKLIKPLYYKLQLWIINKQIKLNFKYH